MRFWIYLLGILYVLSPYDLLPDFFLGGGWIDDLLILGLLGWYHFVFRKDQQRSARGNRNADSTYQWAGRKESSDRNRERPEDIPPRDPHEILGVGREASPDEIKAAYRRLAAQYHPDKVVHLGDEFRELAEKRFKEIQKAYQELSGR
ncbi:MAG: DnaJ domain-containing protein [Deltaproteobacteria bacterium]|nr:DnaJ domain-containing protein [Deltaproteobacteria bacterium]